MSLFGSAAFDFQQAVFPGAQAASSAQAGSTRSAGDGSALAFVVAQEGGEDLCRLSFGTGTFCPAVVIESYLEPHQLNGIEPSHKRGGNRQRG